MPALLMVALMVSSPAQAACAKAESGVISAPTGTGNPPPFMTRQLADLTLVAYYVENPIAGSDYELFGRGSSATVCVLSSVCREIPDFNVAWYDAQGVQSTNHNNQGDNMGLTVPSDADHGIIYMSYGPDPGTADGSVLAGFTYRDGC